MRRFVARTVAAICAEIGREECAGPAGPERPPYDDLDDFVKRQLANAPSFFRVALFFATLVFGLCGFRGGAPFHRLGPDGRRLQMERWRKSRIGAFRDLMRFYDSLCLVALYSRRRET